jgi:thiamine-monophosphate kinase
MADISDGLLGDLGHILKASQMGAEIDLIAMSGLMQTTGLWSCPPDLNLTCVLSGGDDYELVFCAPPSAFESVLAASLACGTPITKIGRITLEPALVLLDAQGQAVQSNFRSFDHFA